MARMNSRRRSSDAIRMLATPKWVGISVLVILASVIFAAASSWQYGRAMDQVNAQRATASVPVPIDALAGGGGDVPAESLGRLAVVTGRYVADAWVVHRASGDGEPGYWLMSALDDGSGTLTAVLRGWVPERPDASQAAAGGTVAVTGRVSSPENFYTNVAPAGADELVAITSERLTEIWHEPIRPGYLVLTAQEPALAPGDPVPVKSVFGEDAAVGFPWQNAGYAVQWLTFIGFTGFMYWRLLRDDLQRIRPAAPGGGAEHDPVAA